MGVNNNWRPVRTMDDWMRDIEKRLMHEERRPSVPHPVDVVGPGFGPYAVEVTDWNSDGPIVGGHFYSMANQVVNSPDDTKNWMGIVQSNSIGQGLQRVWEYIDTAEDPSPDPDLFTRAFHTHEDATREYTAWIQGGGGGGGGIAGVTVSHDGDVPVGPVTQIDFNLNGVDYVDFDYLADPPTAIVGIPGLAVEDEGTVVDDRVYRLNFVGDGVTAVPGSVAREINVSIPGAGSGVTGTLDAWSAYCTTVMDPIPTTATPVPGCTITASAGGPDENFLVVAAADLGWQSGGATSLVSLSIDGVDWVEPGGALSQIVATSSDTQRITAHQNWLVHGLTAGSHVFTLRARQSAGVGILRTTHTTFTVVRLVGAIGPQGPPGGAIGPAGGDLTGTYPDPEIGPGKVTSTEIAANAIYQAHIVDGEVTWSKMAASTKDQAQAIASMRTLGFGATQALAGTTRLDQVAVPTAPVSLNGQKVTNLPASGANFAPNDAVPRWYVQQTAEGLDPKPSVKIATTGNMTLTGSGQTIDGVVVADGNRILVKDQTNPAQNGIYWNNTAGPWTRVNEMDTWFDVPGAYVFVEEGTVNGDTGWVCTSNQAGTLETTPITWVKFMSAAGMPPAGPAGGDLTGTYPNPTLSATTVQALRADVQDEGVNKVLDIAVLNFKGAGVTAAQDSLGVAGITIPGIPTDNARQLTITLPALPAGTWVQVPGAPVGGNHEFREFGGRHSEVHLDVQENQSIGGVLDVRSDFAWSAGQIVGYFVTAL